MKAGPEKLKEKGSNCTVEIQTLENMSDGLGWGGQSTVSERIVEPLREMTYMQKRWLIFACTMPE